MFPYYVYILRDPRRANVPFYVGKGKGRRATLHFTSKTTRGYNPRKDAVVDAILKAGMLPLIEQIWQGQSETQAYIMEIELIAHYGREGIDQGGILTNLSPGGDGCRRPLGAYAGEKNPFFGKRHSEASKKLISENNGRIGFTGHRHTDESKSKISAAKKGQIPWMAGRKHTDAAKKKMSEAPHPGYWGGKTRPLETCQKISASLQGNQQSDAAKEKNRQSQLRRFSGPDGEQQRSEVSTRSKRMWEKRHATGSWPNQPPEAHTTLARKLHGKGLSLRQISAKLEQEGFVARSGNAYGAESIKRMIKSRS